MFSWWTILRKNDTLDFCALLAIKRTPIWLCIWWWSLKIGEVMRHTYSILTKKMWMWKKNMTLNDGVHLSYGWIQYDGNVFVLLSSLYGMKRREDNKGVTQCGEYHLYKQHCSIMRVISYLVETRNVVSLGHKSRKTMLTLTFLLDIWLFYHYYRITYIIL